MHRLIILLFFSILMLSCSREEHLGTKSKDAYYIQLDSFGTKDSAESFISGLKNRTSYHVFSSQVTKPGGKQYFIASIGYFTSSYEAGWAAYSLKKSKIINKFDITHNLETVRDEFADVVMVGNFRGVPSLFKYNLTDHSKEKIWYKANEKVVDFCYSGDMKNALFITSSGYGRKSIFPYVNNVKLYKLDLSSLKAEKIKDIGSGIQLFTSGEMGAVLRIVLNSFDRNKTTYIVQNTSTFSYTGGLIKSERKIFDLVKENYPGPMELIFDNTSPDRKKQFTIAEEGKEVTLLLKNAGMSKKIITQSQKISQVNWSMDSRYLIFSTVDISPLNRTLTGRSPETSSLYIYSVNEGKIKNKWDGSGYKNFILRGDLLFFDSGFENSSQIIVYNYKENNSIDTITLKGGCGIRNIPYIPDFGV